MYFFFQIILGEDKFINWVDIIATRLQELSQASGISSFDMTSYLFYIMACGKEWKGLPHSG